LPAGAILLAEKKGLNTGYEIGNTKIAISQNETGEREKKIMNSVLNTSIILMSTLMNAFNEVVVNATDAMASGMAEAIGGKEAGDQVHREVRQKLPEVDEKMKKLISDVRKDVYIQIGQKIKEIAPLLSNHTFDNGLKIIKKYDFQLPSLTEELDDNALGHYAKLLASEDSTFVELFKELTGWLNSLPKL
jgi:DNA-binding transcriptional MerR regulator